MPDLDEADLTILRNLQLDGRMTLANLAAKVGLSSTPCWRRVKRLEDEGVITGYVATVDPTKVGLGVEVVIHVRLDKHVHSAIGEFVAAIRRIPAIVQCFSMTGDHDVLIRGLVPDLAALNRLLMTDLAEAPGIRQMSSSFVLERLVDHKGIPL